MFARGNMHGNQGIQGTRLPLKIYGIRGAERSRVFRPFARLDLFTEQKPFIPRKAGSLLPSSVKISDNSRRSLLIVRAEVCPVPNNELQAKSC
jgi:hypothetical protein